MLIEGKQMKFWLLIKIIVIIIVIKCVCVIVAS
jgi:hypothetical protein